MFAVSHDLADLILFASILILVIAVCSATDDEW